VPHEEHDDQDQDKVLKDMTMKEGEIAQLDASYPTMRVSTNDEKQQPPHRTSAMHESTYQEDVKNKTYRENRSCAKNVEGEIAPLDALFPTTQVSSADEKWQTHHRMPAMDESTYQEEVQNDTYQEEGSCAENVMMMAQHQPKDRQNLTTSPALTMTQGASRRQGT
jgi:hypothetical protein